MSQLPTDEQIVLAIQHKKDVFTSRFVKNTSNNTWSGLENWYFKHICTVLEHAKRIFETDVDEDADEEIAQGSNTNAHMHNRIDDSKQDQHMHDWHNVTRHKPNR